MRRFLLAGLLASLTFAALAAPARSFAQITQTPNGYLLRRKFEKGQKLSYTLTSETTRLGAKGQTLKTSAPMTVTVTDVKSGVGTLHIQIGPVTANGKPAAPVQTTTRQEDARAGVVHSGAANPASELQDLLNKMPDKPLRVGVPQTASKTISAGGKSVNVRTTTVLKGFKTVHGIKAAELVINATLTGAISVKSSGDTMLAVSDGSLVTLHTEQTVTAKQGPQTVSVKSVTSLARR